MVKHLLAGSWMLLSLCRWLVLYSQQSLLMQRGTCSLPPSLPVCLSPMYNSLQPSVSLPLCTAALSPHIKKGIFKGTIFNPNINKSSTCKSLNITLKPVGIISAFIDLVVTGKCDLIIQVPEFSS